MIKKKEIRQIDYLISWFLYALGKTISVFDEHFDYGFCSGFNISIKTNKKTSYKKREALIVPVYWDNEHYRGSSITLFLCSAEFDPDWWVTGGIINLVGDTHPMLNDLHFKFKNFEEELTITNLKIKKKDMPGFLRKINKKKYFTVKISDN